MEILITRSEQAKLWEMPHPKKKGDVGYDLHAIERTIIRADNLKNRLFNIINAILRRPLLQIGMANIPTGISMAMPDGIWATIEARSSTCQKMLFTAPSIMDTGYRGEFFIVIYNLGRKDYVVEAGHRLAQVVFHTAIVPKLIEVESLPHSERGSGGFGHTGQ